MIIMELNVSFGNIANFAFYFLLQGELLKSFD